MGVIIETTPFLMILILGTHIFSYINFAGNLAMMSGNVNITTIILWLKIPMVLGVSYSAWALTVVLNPWEILSLIIIY